MVSLSSKVILWIMSTASSKRLESRSECLASDGDSRDGPSLSLNFHFSLNHFNKLPIIKCGAEYQSTFLSSTQVKNLNLPERSKNREDSRVPVPWQVHKERLVLFSAWDGTKLYISRVLPDNATSKKISLCRLRMEISLVHPKYTWWAQTCKIVHLYLWPIIGLKDKVRILIAI